MSTKTPILDSHSRRSLFDMNASAASSSMTALVPESKLSPFHYSRRAAARSELRRSRQTTSQSALSRILQQPLIPESLRNRGYGLQSARRYDRSQSDILSSADEGRTIVIALKKRLRNKVSQEHMLKQDIKASESRLISLENEIRHVVSMKETRVRDFEDEKSKLEDLKLRYAEKAKSDVQLLKRVHKLEMQYRDVNGRLSNKAQGEAYAEREKKTSVKDFIDAERRVMSVKYEKAEKEHLRDSEVSKVEELKLELARKQNQLQRDVHGNQVEVQGLRKIVLEHEATISELDLEIRAEREKLAALSLALEENAESVQVRKLELKREITEARNNVDEMSAKRKEIVSRIEDLENEILLNETKIKGFEHVVESAKSQKIELNAQIEDIQRRKKEMTDRVKVEHEKGHVLISKLKQKTMESASLKDKFETLEKEARESSLKASQIKLQVETVQRRIRDEELKDEDEKHLLQIARDYIKMTEERSQGKKESLAKALSELEGANERIHGFEDKINAEKEERERLKQVIEKQLKELEDYESKINESESALMVLQHREELKAKELASKIEARDELAEKFRSRLSSMEASADELKEAIANMNEEAVERKEVLEKKITEVVAKDAKLRGELRRHDTHAGELKQGVEEKSDVAVRAESELIAAEREVIELKATHDRQVAALENKLSLARAELREFEPKVKEAEIELKSINTKYEDIVKRNEVTQRETRSAESQCHIFENRLRELDNKQKHSVIIY